LFFYFFRGRTPSPPSYLFKYIYVFESPLPTFLHQRRKVGKRRRPAGLFCVLIRLFAGNGHRAFAYALLGELRLQNIDLLFALVLTNPILLRKAGLGTLIALITLFSGKPFRD
jgi:hypothetical protein